MSISIVYGSTPSRLADRAEEIMGFVAKKGKACLHPFLALPYKYYEGGNVGRDQTIEFCCKLTSLCDEFGLFGVSEGCLTELEFWLSQPKTKDKPVLVFVREFDIGWEDVYEKIKNKYPKSSTLLDSLL